MNTFLVRYSEIGLKGPRTRNDMEKRLVKNIKIAHSLKGYEVRIRTERGRIFVESENRETSINCLSRIMGIKSFSEVFPLEFSGILEIVNFVKNIYWERVRGKKFAVSVKRAGEHNFSSMDLEIKIADSLYSNSSGVDLKNPEVKIEVEVRGNVAYVISERINGPGGLPVGSEGRMTAMVSGGMDSPVAAWYMLRRGSPVDMVFFSLAYPIDVTQFLKNAQALYENWYFGYDPDIFIIDAGRLVDDYLAKGKMKFANVSFKKIMYTITEKIANDTKSNGIITGESSGQVSSQTPENLRELSRFMDIPIHRPLLGFDKDEIIDLAKKIGTYNPDPFGEFCAIFGETPVTRIKREELDEDMQNLYGYFPSKEEIHRIKGSKIYEFLDSIHEKYEIDKIGQDDIVIDLRDPLTFKQWHYPGAINLSLSKVYEKMSTMEDNKKIILYCQKGLQSAHVAARLNSMGYQAYFINLDRIRNQTQ